MTLHSPSTKNRPVAEIMTVSLIAATLLIVLLSQAGCAPKPNVHQTTSENASSSAPASDMSGAATGMNADDLTALANTSENAPMVSETGGSTNNIEDKFYGVRHVPAATVHELIPEAKGKPLLVEFRSEFCLDCKRMAPLLEGLLKEHPNTVVEILDVKHDKARAAMVFKEFDPSIVPVLLFIGPDGETRDVLYGFNDTPQLKASLSAIQKPAKA